MLGIIGAMDVEVNALKEKIKNPAATVLAGIEFVCGELEHVMVCVAQCGIGKVNAALCAQIMIDRFAADKIINVGVACSLSPEVAIKNVVIADAVCQHDMDITPAGAPRGYLDGLNTIMIATDKAMSDALAGAAIRCGERIHRGTIASGDIFIASDALKQSIVQEFGAICGEMEGGAIGHVCAANGIPFAVLRSISDGGDESAAMDYPTFKVVAAKISGAIVLDYIRTEKTQLDFHA